MKILSWNVNGIRSVLRNGFLKDIEKEKAEILCLQETRAHPEQVDEILKEYKYHYWNPAEKKGYSGTAIFSKKEPISLNKGIGHELDNEGRVIMAEFDKFYLINVYTPNSGRGLVRLDIRKDWDKHFLKYIKSLEKKKPVVVCGDFNVAHKEIDLANPKPNYDKTAGYTQIEINGFQNLVDNNFVDSFREFDKSPKKYTYWSAMFKARERNVGWRIDYFLVSKKIMKNIKKSFILDKILGSDHCPVGIELK